MTTVTMVVSEDPGGSGPLHRTRVALLHPDSSVPLVDEHLRIRLPAPPPLPLLADVLVAGGEGTGQVAALAARYPAALVVAVHHGPRCWLRLGGHECVLLGAFRPGPSWAVRASLAHAWLVAGLPATEFAAAAVRVIRTARTHSAGQDPAGSSPAPSPGPSALSRSHASRASADSDWPASEYRISASR